MIDYLALWERAAKSEHGIGIANETPRELTRHLYETRQLHPKPEFLEIRVCHPNGGREVWLVKPPVDSL